MTRPNAIDLIKDAYERMSPQMQQAARYLLERSSEAALHSMREVSRRADVPPSTMTRLAQRVGFSGYDELREVFVEDIRRNSDWLGNRAEIMLSKRAEVGEPGLVDDFSGALSGYIAALPETSARGRMEAAADKLMEAERIFCVGARSAHPVAYMFSYLLSYFLPRVRTLGDAGGADLDALLGIGAGDVVFAVSFEPSARTTMDAVHVASNAGCSIVSISDHELSDLARQSDVTIVVPRHAPSFFDTMTPAFATAEMLAAMIASRVGPNVTERVRERESRLAEMGVWANAHPPKQTSRETAQSDPQDDRETEK